MLSNLCPPSRLTSKKNYLIVPPPHLPSRPLNSKKSYIKKQWWFGKLGPRKMNYWYLLFCGNFYSQYYCSMYICIYVSITWELYCPSCLICIKILLLLFLFSNFILFFNCSFLVYISFLCTQSLFERFRMDRIEY